MIKKAKDRVKDQDTRDVLDYLQEAVQGNTLELSAAPTAADPLLEDNESGFYNNSLYVRKGSTIYVFASSSQITVTGDAE